MKPVLLCLLIGLLEHSQDVVYGSSYPCDVFIEKRVIYSNENRHCDGKFPCDFTIRGRNPYIMNCGYLEHGTSGPEYFCDGYCPDEQTSFSSVCEANSGLWHLPLVELCKSDTTVSAEVTTTSRWRTNSEDDGGIGSTTILWTTVMAIILAMIMLCICAMAIKASRNRQPRQTSLGGSPTMIYSVTLSCGTGQALRDSINQYLRQASQPGSPAGPSVDIVGPPSYEEVTQEVDKPPPYSDVAGTNNKN